MSKNFLAYYQSDFDCYTIEAKDNNDALVILPTMIHFDCPKNKINDLIIKDLMIKSLEQLVYLRSKIERHIDV